MNGFQKRAIKSWEKTASRWVKAHIVLSILTIILGVFTLKGVVGAIQAGNPFSVKQIVISAVTKGVKTDSQGHTNILLIGIGGEGHDGENLTDTMIVASIDNDNNLVPMLSIPRDLFVENEMVGWGTRINGVYEWVYESTGDKEIAMNELINEVENVVGMEIHYYAKVDFQGFEDIVDAVGGVDVTLDYDFYDPYYPADPGTGAIYDPFSLSAGEHTLDGEDALKYVRSRKTTSDFDRAKRQQNVITAIKNKALSLGFLLNPSKIQNTIAAISKHFETNMTISEMINFASMAEDFNSNSILTQVLNDEAYSTGGFLYTPDREEYGGAFVLIPFAEDFSEIQRFAQLYFYNTNIFLDQVPIQIVNGTKEESLAGLTKMYLARYGFNVVSYGNAANENVTETQIIPLVDEEFDTNLDEVDNTLDVVQMILSGSIPDETPLEYNAENWDSDAQIIIELGEDFVNYYYENSNYFYLGFY